MFLCFVNTPANDFIVNGTFFNKAPLRKSQIIKDETAGLQDRDRIHKNMCFSHNILWLDMTVELCICDLGRSEIHWRLVFV